MIKVEVRIEDENADLVLEIDDSDTTTLGIQVLDGDGHSAALYFEYDDVQKAMGMIAESRFLMQQREKQK